MGAYLSEPVTEKISSDEYGDNLLCGASSMQGWRVSQEDAHNCIIDFDKDTSLFAVYDGHGGHEVALYCSQKFPDFLKNIEAYKKGDLKQALIDAFVQFDATILTPEVVAILKELAGSKKDDETKEDGISSEDETHEDVNNLYEEASMPLEQLMEKYQNQHLKKVQECDHTGKSPYLRAKKIPRITDGAGSSGVSSSSSGNSRLRKPRAEKSDGNTSNGEPESTTSEPDCSNSKEEEEKEEKIVIVKEDTGKIKENDLDKKNVQKQENEEKLAVESGKEEKVVTNGDVNDKNEIKDEDSEVKSEASPSKKGKNKATKSPKKLKVKLNPAQSRQIYQAILTGVTADDSEDTDDEHDDTFKADEKQMTSSDEDEENEEESDWGEEESSEMEDSDENCEEEEEYMEDEDDDIHMNVTEEPGSDSGCTAVVALLRGNQLYVANAGDSRCIVCRNGKVVEMSFDHKPENEEESNRIVKAGGKVTSDGRVNGGLNLSRAIGDHAYKQNKDLPAEEQMITAVPDIITLTLDKNDDFMVLACDGIWNFMTNEEVIEFVGSRLNDGRRKISEICEEMFDHCLAPNTMGDGTGCDNMTAIVVQFKNGKTIIGGGSSLKRSASPSHNSSTEEETLKRAKLDNEVVTDTTNNEHQSETNKDQVVTSGEVSSSDGGGEESRS